MATRNIKDAKDLTTNELVYFKGHAKATFMSDGTTVEDAIDMKQDALVSGTNIKTFNGESLLGSGDIAVSGAGTYVPMEETYLTDIDGLGINVSPNVSVVVAPTSNWVSLHLVEPTDTTVTNVYNITILLDNDYTSPSITIDKEISWDDDIPPSSESNRDIFEITIRYVRYDYLGMNVYLGSWKKYPMSF